MIRVRLFYSESPTKQARSLLPDGRNSELRSLDPFERSAIRRQKTCLTQAFLHVFFHTHRIFQDISAFFEKRRFPVILSQTTLQTSTTGSAAHAWAE